LLTKYKGSEDHLVQKLSVQYNKEKSIPEHDEVSFTDAVKKSKRYDEAAVNTAKEHLHSNIEEDEDEPKKSWQTKKRKKKYEWPKKEEKELDKVQEEEHSQSGSEYSRDEVNGTSSAVIVQVSELLNDVYEKRRF